MRVEDWTLKQVQGDGWEVALERETGNRKDLTKGAHAHETVDRLLDRF